MKQTNKLNLYKYNKYYSKNLVTKFNFIYHIYKRRKHESKYWLCSVCCNIEFKPFLGDDIEKYREAFEKWYFEEEETEEGIVIRERSDLHYECFNA